MPSTGSVRLLIRLVAAACFLLGGPAGWAFAAEIIAHRGASYDAPENTLASVMLAWEQQADAVEIDVYMSKDGRIVAIHDKSTERTAGQKRDVVEQTLDELKTLDVGRWKGERWTGERIPTLAEILDTVPDGKRLFIEIKCGPEILPQLKRVLARSGKPPVQTAIISFSQEVVAAAKTSFPRLRVYWIVEQKKDEQTGEWRPTVEELIEVALRMGVDGLDLRDTPPIDGEFVTEVKQAGLQVFVWTVNSPDDARRLQQAGVDGITTDRPKLLRAKLTREGR